MSRGNAQAAHMAPAAARASQKSQSEPMHKAYAHLQQNPHKQYVFKKEGFVSKQCTRKENYYSHLPKGMACSSQQRSMMQLTVILCPGKERSSFHCIAPPTDAATEGSLCENKLLAFSHIFWCLSQYYTAWKQTFQKPIPN